MADPITTWSGGDQMTVVKDTFNGNFEKRFGMDSKTVTADYTLTATDELVYIDPTSAAITIATPAAASYPNRTWFLMPLNVANTVTINPNAAETFKDTAATKTIGTARRLVKLWNDGTNWFASYQDFLP